jgi:hypothetical protein
MDCFEDEEEEFNSCDLLLRREILVSMNCFREKKG